MHRKGCILHVQSGKQDIRYKRRTRADAFYFAGASKIPETNTLHMTL